MSDKRQVEILKDAKGSILSFWRPDKDTILLITSCESIYSGICCTKEDWDRVKVKLDSLFSESQETHSNKKPSLAIEQGLVNESLKESSQSDSLEDFGFHTASDAISMPAQQWEGEGGAFSGAGAVEAFDSPSNDSSSIDSDGELF